MPLPFTWLATWRHGYAVVQPVVSRTAAVLPLPALDLWLGGAGLALGWLAVSYRRRWRLVPMLRAAAATAAAGWLSFLLLWGWHYQVPTIEARLDIAPAELSAARGEAFAQAAVLRLNALHEAAHGKGWPDRAALPGVLGPHLARVLPALGVSRLPALVPPRWTLLDRYFRWAGIDGMTNPFGLEVLLNSRVLPFELPALAAHEYAHLAGFADESDASVVAWLACGNGGDDLQYSGALAVLPHLLGGLPPERQRRVRELIGTGPRRDLEAIGARLAEQQPWVHAVAWQTYDGFLKANRVDEGVARYDAVARVLVAAGDPATGRLRRLPAAWPPARH